MVAFGGVSPVADRYSALNSIGNVALQTVWSDPEFNAGQSAVYYVRVLEIPTPRWSTIQAVRAGLPLSDKVAPTLQERAWSSPIWYVPPRGA